MSVLKNLYLYTTIAHLYSKVDMMLVHGPFPKPTNIWPGSKIPSFIQKQTYVNHMQNHMQN